MCDCATRHIGIDCSAEGCHCHDLEPHYGVIDFDAEADGIEQAVFLALGAASTCWDDISSAGVFDSTRAKAIGDDLVRYVRENTIRIMNEAEERIVCPSCGQKTATAVNFPMHPTSKDSWRCGNCGVLFTAKEHP